MPLLGNGMSVALDSYHLHIEERSLAAVLRPAGEHLVHVQVCGSDRGALVGNQTTGTASCRPWTMWATAGP